MIFHQYIVGFFVILYVILMCINVYKVKRNANLKNISFFLVLLLVILLTLTTLFLPIGNILVCIFALYRLLILIILKIKHGSKFGGLLNGPDAFHMATDTSDSVINCLLVFECTNAINADTIFENMREVVRNMQKRTKFNSKFKNAFGYSYMLKHELTIDDCIRKMKIIDNQEVKLEKADFLTILNEYFNEELPQNNTVPWEIIIGMQPIKWKDTSFTYFPFLFRSEHAIADGITLLQVMVSVLSDKKNNVNASEVRPEKSKTFKWKKFLQNIKYVVMFPFMCVYLYVLIPAAYVANLLLKAKDNNSLCGPATSKQKHFTLDIEISPGFIEKIKYIKKKIPGTSFPEVVLTAISASLQDHFEKRRTFHDYVSAAVPVLFGSSKIYRINPEKLDINNLKIDNKYSFLLLNFPMYIEQKTNNVSEIFTRLTLIKKQTAILKESYDYQMMLVFTKIICACLPQKVLRMLLKVTKCTAIISVLPGPPKVQCFGGTTYVSDVIPFSPHACDIGTTFTFNTYDGRVQIGVSVDQSLIPDRGEVEEIGKSITYYIDLLYDYVDTLQNCETLHQVV